jgi:glucan phosphoethanolaminetransferase (alkaline phosphatase superfamily)
MNTQYIPGVCNIGPQEIKMRMMVGWVGLAITLALGVLLFRLPISPWTRLVLFLPAFVSAMGFLQAAFHFCVAFGTKGLFNMDKAVGQTESVSQTEFRAKDQKKVVQIYFLAVVIALVVAIAAVYL